MRVGLRTPDGDLSYEVFVKGKDKSVIVTKSPKKDVGRNMLMLDKDFYLYMPNLKKSLRLSLSQKLSGQVANGDIARTRWHGDYNAKVEKAEGDKTTLFLDGKQSGLTYQKIRLTVDTKTGRPLNAEYLSLDGSVLLKKAEFGNYKEMAGAVRPSRINIVDAAGATSKIFIMGMEKAKLDDAFFSQGKLDSLK
jgi:outer membrane lipoprotein-sorting protein